MNGGKGQIQDEGSTDQIEIIAGTVSNSAPLPWHELTNSGDTTLRFLIIERKYEPLPEEMAANSRKGTKLRRRSEPRKGPLYGLC